MRHRNSRELTIKLNIIKYVVIDSEKNSNRCTTQKVLYIFLGHIVSPEELGDSGADYRVRVLGYSKSFLFYQFNMGSLLKSLQKMTFLREISLEFATKDSSCEDFLLAMLEKRMSRHNIHLNIIKV